MQVHKMHIKITRKIFEKNLICATGDFKFLDMQCNFLTLKEKC